MLMLVVPSSIAFCRSSLFIPRSTEDDVGQAISGLVQGAELSHLVTTSSHLSEDFGHVATGLKCHSNLPGFRKCACLLPSGQNVQVSCFRWVQILWQIHFLSRLQGL